VLGGREKQTVRQDDRRAHVLELAVLACKHVDLALIEAQLADVRLCRRAHTRARTGTPTSRRRWNHQHEGEGGNREERWKREGL